MSLPGIASLVKIIDNNSFLFQQSLSKQLLTPHFSQSYLLNTIPPEHPQENNHLQIEPVTSSSKQNFNNLNSPDLKLSPQNLNFLPTSKWSSDLISFSDLVSSFFQVRSSKRIHFIHKLWNALCITQTYPQLLNFVGVIWLSSDVIEVHKNSFASLLKISKPTSALFNIQGSFSSHGFKEISKDDALKRGISASQLINVDESNIRLFIHKAGNFRKDSTEEEVQKCTWKVVTL